MKTYQNRETWDHRRPRRLHWWQRRRVPVATGRSYRPYTRRYCPDGSYEPQGWTRWRHPYGALRWGCPNYLPYPKRRRYERAA